MRSALILASLALTILAAPVPKAEGRAPARRHLTDNAAPIETFIDKRYQRIDDRVLKNSRGIQDEVDVEKRQQRHGKEEHSEKEDGDDDVEKRDRRVGAIQRSEKEDDEDDAEKRDRRVGAIQRSEEDDENDVEKRGRRVGAIQRSEKEDDEDDVEKRDRRVGAIQRSEKEDDEDDVEKRGRRVGTIQRSEGVKNTIRNIYDGVVGIVEALKTRGFSSANSLPARQAM